MGPLATVKFLEELIYVTPAKKDQEHIDVITYTIPSIPDRTEYIRDHSKPNPGEIIKRYIETLAPQVDFIAIPCMTAMYFYEDIRDIAEIINFASILLEAVKEQGHLNVGILATEGTVVGGVFDKYNDYGINIIYPDDEFQEKMMDVIYDIKNGEAYNIDQFYSVANNLRKKGAEVAILACTELKIIKEAYRLDPTFYVDGLNLLAKAVVTRMEEYVKKGDC